MPTITIQGTVIDFPSEGTSPSWAGAVVQFAQAVEAALNFTVGPFDVANQIMDIDAYNPGTGVDISSLAFPVADVRGFTAVITVYRNTSSVTATQQTTIQAVYNAANSVGNKWEASQVSVGDASITFNVDDDGQITFTTTTLAGTSHNGFLSYYGKATENE